MSSSQHEYFQLFALPEQFAIDTKLLEANFRKIQSTSHPDRFVSASAAEKLASMQLATLSNEAYATLKNAARRAKYLLEKKGIDAVADTNTALPMDFLMQQMEWRESLDEVRDQPNQLDQLYQQVEATRKELLLEVEVAIDQAHNFQLAAEKLRALLFIDKFSVELEDAISA